MDLDYYTLTWNTLHQKQIWKFISWEVHQMIYITNTSQVLRHNAHFVTSLPWQKNHTYVNYSPIWLFTVFLELQFEANE